MSESQSKLSKHGIALDSAAVNLQEQANNIQQTQQALSNLTDALSAGDATQVQAAQKKYSDALSKLPAELRTKLLQEQDSTKDKKYWEKLLVKLQKTRLLRKKPKKPTLSYKNK